MLHSFDPVLMASDSDASLQGQLTPRYGETPALSEPILLQRGRDTNDKPLVFSVLRSPALVLEEQEGKELLGHGSPASTPYARTLLPQQPLKIPSPPGLAALDGGRHPQASEVPTAIFPTWANSSSEAGPRPLAPGAVKPLAVESIGSRGHPRTCATACRFFRRKAGCRDGENCPNCHMCYWQRASTKGLDDDTSLLASSQEAALLRLPKKEVPMSANLCSGAFAQGLQALQQEQLLQQPQQPQPSQLSRRLAEATEEDEPIVSSTGEVAVRSIGSSNHPRYCGLPCKYVRKRGGCKNGVQCARCHLCFWSRGSENEKRALMLQQMRQTAEDSRDSPVATSANSSSKPSARPETSHQPKQPTGEVSVGSVGHPYQCCGPCPHLATGRCEEGWLCRYCHVCEPKLPTQIPAELRDLSRDQMLQLAEALQQEAMMKNRAAPSSVPSSAPPRAPAATHQQQQQPLVVKSMMPRMSPPSSSAHQFGASKMAYPSHNVELSSQMPAYVESSQMFPSGGRLSAESASAFTLFGEDLNASSVAFAERLKL
eukprot:TRINITY_DN24552_c0_g1_i1.p1 TRINITY_DN24552_c0_g1~~TRINITY_DN24552_c0_g1_i1.p1  ORF type:complete len:543 (+),score=100.68 TRINITY_DN24552_c0_g1_i1:139-1767(+)